MGDTSSPIERTVELAAMYTGEQTGAFVPFRMWDQNTTVPRRATHSHFDWTSDGSCHGQ